MSVVGKKRSKLRRRLVILILIGAVTVAAEVVYFHLFLGFPSMGSGAAGPAVPLEPFERTWHEGPVVLLGIGDSVTKGFGASPGLSYFERLVGNPSGEWPDMEGRCLSKVFPDFTHENFAVSGSNSIQCLENQLPLIEPFPKETLGVVVLTTGGNDLIHWYGRGEVKEGAMYGASLAEARPWIANYEVRLDAITREVNARFPGGCHIFLADIYDPSDGVGDPSVVRLPPWPDMLAILGEYNAVIGRIVEKHGNVHPVGMREVFLGHGFHCKQPWRPHYRKEDPHLWFATNIEDPNDRGYDAVRRVFLNAMAEVFAAEDRGPVQAGS